MILPAWRKVSPSGRIISVGEGTIADDAKVDQFRMRRGCCKAEEEQCTSSKRTAPGGQQPKPRRCKLKNEHELSQPFGLRSARSTRPSLVCGKRPVVSPRTKAVGTDATSGWPQCKPRPRIFQRRRRGTRSWSYSCTPTRNIRMMPHNAAQQLSMFVQQRMHMQYEIDCMQFEMKGLTRPRSILSMFGGARSEASDR